MSLSQAFFLGVIQGLTEFLPVSSSAHLAICQHLFRLTDNLLFFDIALHCGTLLSVTIFLRKEILALTKGTLSFLLHRLRGQMSTIDLQERTMARLAGLMVIALIPTAAIGLLLHDVVEYFFQSLKSVGSFLLITGIILWITKTITQGQKDIATLTTADAFIIGCAQGLAVAPGISRSGATIACGLLRNLEKEAAVRFSFLLSIPAIIGATIVEWKNPSFENTEFLHMILGALTAALTGYIALKILIGMVKKGHLYYFAPYCWVLGGMTIILSFMVS